MFCRRVVFVLAPEAHHPSLSNLNGLVLISNIVLIWSFRKRVHRFRSPCRRVNNLLQKVDMTFKRTKLDDFNLQHFLRKLWLRSEMTDRRNGVVISPDMYYTKYA